MSQEPISLIEPPLPPVEWRLDRSAGISVHRPELDSSQRAVVDHRGGPLLVLAGPGTGKTTTLTEAVIARLTGEEPLAAEQVLVLTFARKAAEEIRDRILTRLGGGVVPTVCTFHSLALGLVREFSPRGERPLTLLTAPEQEVRLREILRGIAVDERVRQSWPVPDSFADALETRGLAVEVRNALSRARSLGIDEGELAAAVGGDPEWAAVARLLGEYLDRIGEQDLLDYNELIVQARALASQPATRELLRARYRAIFVDEYQDCDPLQIDLLRDLLHPEAALVAVGDPDQSIYAFRGAAARAVRDFRSDFDFHQSPPEVKSLKVTRRFGQVLRDTALGVISGNGIEPGVPSDYRDLQTLHAGGLVTFTAFDSAEVEAEEVAESIRRRVLSDSELSWRDVAVIVRSGVRSIPTLERALLQAGVPVATSYDDLPLGSEPAVATLLQALAAVADPDALKQPATARALLTSPLARFDAADLRRVARLVRDAHSDEGGFSEVWLGRALADPATGLGVEPGQDAEAWSRLVDLRNLLGRVRSRAQAGASVHELLYLIWTGTNWPESLRRRALSAAAGAAQANHDLDAVRSLFTLAATEAQSHQAGGYVGRIRNFLELVASVAVAASPTEPAVRPDAVALLTAHRSKGLQWKVVYVCSADEGTWPDVRRRTSLLEPDRLQLEVTSAGPEPVLGELPDRSQVVKEERRLFYVACTRAEAELHLSSTSLDEESGRLPSRFIKHLPQFESFMAAKAAEAAESAAGAGEDRELSSSPRYSAMGLVAQLRRIGTSPQASLELKRQVAARLARLADLRDPAGRALVPAADPRAWWAVAPETATDNPIDDPMQAVAVRGSSLHLLEECTLNWFLAQRASAETPTSSAMAFGSVVHAVAQAFISGELQPGSPEVLAKIDEVWPKLRFETSWLSQKEKEEAVAAVNRFAAWLAARGSDSELFSEVAFNEVVELPLTDGTLERFLLKGSIDIIETSDDGAQLFDIKTSKSVDSKAEAAEHAQLGLYQYAVNRGVVTGLVADRSERATLMFVRHPEGKGKTTPKLREQPALPVQAEPNWLEQKLEHAIDVVRSERYEPSIGPACSNCAFKSLCPVQPEGKAVLA